MKLASLFKISTSSLAKLILLSLVIGVSSVLSPFTIRSVVDGFLVSQDRSALLFALGIIAAFEAISFSSDFLFRSILSEQTAEKMILLKSSILAQFKEKRIFQLKDSFLRTWEIDIKRTVNYEMKLKWLRYKDLFMLLLLSFVMINLSGQAGLFILAVSAIQFGLAAWDTSRNKEDISSLRHTEEIEHRQLSHFFQNLQKSYDTGFLGHDIESLNKSITTASEATEKTEDRRSFLLNIKTVSRGVLILGALAIAAFGGVDMTWAAGTFWALLMIVFRLTNPIYSLAQWFYSEKSILASKQRVDDLLNSLSSEPEGTVYYQQFKNTIGKTILSENKQSQKIQIIVPKDLQVQVQSAIRIWTSKYLWQKSKLLSNSELSLINNNLLKYFIFNYSTQQFKSSHLNFKTIATDFVYLITTLPLPINDFDENYLWNTDINKFVKLDITNKETQQLKTAVISDSVSWNEAFRDIKTYAKLSIPFEVIHFSSDDSINQHFLTQNLRDVDHCLALPNNNLVFILVGSTGQGFLSLQQRLKDANLKVVLRNKLFYTPNKENWRPTLESSEEHILSIILKPEQKCVESAA